MNGTAPAPSHDVVQRFEFDITRNTPLGFPIESGLSFIGGHASNVEEATAMVKAYLFELDKSDGNVSVFTIRRTPNGQPVPQVDPFSNSDRRGTRLHRFVMRFGASEMKEKVVFGGYDGKDLLKIAEAVVEDAHTQNNVMEFRRICEYVLELTEECVPPNALPDDVRCH